MIMHIKLNFEVNIESMPHSMLETFPLILMMMD